MIAVTVIEAATGRVLRQLTLPDAASLLDNWGEGERIEAGHIDGRLFFMEGVTPVPYPPRPGPWAVFDYAARVWTDPRTAEELAAGLQARRAGTALDKSDLLIRLAQAGILTPAEAEEAATGVIVAAAYALGLSEAALDAIFGIGAP